MHIRTLALLSAQILVAALALSNPGTGLAQTEATQVSEGDQVTIKATWQGPTAGPVFTVVLDTHSVNLDTIDLLQLAVLRIDQVQEVQPIAWEAPAGGHHREGTLTFPATDGSPLIGPDTQLLELVIRDVAGLPERVLQWVPS